MSMVSYDLSGRVALVTGAAQGLGAGMATALAKAGALVVVADIEDDQGRATAEEIKQTGAIATYLHLDVTDDQAWQDAVAAIVGEHGGLDVMVNNAGVEITGLVTELRPDDLRRMFEVNVLGTALGVKHALR